MSLTVRYVLASEVELPEGPLRLTEEHPIVATEERGEITYHCLPGPFTEAGVRAQTAATAGILAGGQVFQLWRGEII